MAHKKMGQASFIEAFLRPDASLIEADVKRPPKDEGEVAARDPGAGSGASSATRRTSLSTTAPI